MTDKQISYSQCPGECYEKFWEEEGNSPPFNVDKLIEDYKASPAYKDKIKYLISFYHKHELTKRYRHHKTMKDAIGFAIELLDTGNYIIESITTEYPSIGQD